MKKKLILGVAAAVCGIALAEDSYLYWQINQQGAEKPIEFAYAQVKATKDGGDIYVGEAMGVTDVGKTAISAGPIDSAFNMSAYGEGSGYSFVVELMNSELGVIGESATFSYADIAPYIWSPMGQKGASAWTVTAFTVPEPTSGLLLLLGVAGLALRRKRA